MFVVQLTFNTVTDDAGNKNNLLTGPYEYKEPNKDLENSSRHISRTPTLSSTSTNVNMASKPEQEEQPVGGGDAPSSPVNENIPVILQDDIQEAEALIREKYDASPTPSKIGKRRPHCTVHIAYAKAWARHLAFGSNKLYCLYDATKIWPLVPSVPESVLLINVFIY